MIRRLRLRFVCVNMAIVLVMLSAMFAMAYVLTQQDVANILGTSQTMYARYERGANELPIRHLIALCRYYRVSADYILGLKDEMN